MGPRHRRSRRSAPQGCWALVALKAPGQGKQRLAGVLCAEQRQALIEHMTAHVLAVLRACPDIVGIAVTSPQPVTGDLLWIPDTLGELNASLLDAARQLSRQGVRELLVLHADLPWLASDDVGALVAAGRLCGMALAADRHGRGTNALYTRLPMRIDLAFGPDSAARHLGLAAALGLTAARVDRPGLAFDVDEPDELRLLGPWPRALPLPASAGAIASSAPTSTAPHCDPRNDPPNSVPRSLTWHPTLPIRPAAPI